MARETEQQEQERRRHQRRERNGDGERSAPLGDEFVRIDARVDDVGQPRQLARDQQAREAVEALGEAHRRGVLGRFARDFQDARAGQVARDETRRPGHARGQPAARVDQRHGRGADVDGATEGAHEDFGRQFQRDRHAVTGGHRCYDVDRRPAAGQRGGRRICGARARAKLVEGPFDRQPLGATFGMAGREHVAGIVDRVKPAADQFVSCLLGQIGVERAQRSGQRRRRASGDGTCGHLGAGEHVARGFGHHGRYVAHVARRLDARAIVRGDGAVREIADEGSGDREGEAEQREAIARASQRAGSEADRGAAVERVGHGRRAA
jgi:hypothetical protein